MVSPSYTFRLSQHGLDLDANGHHALGWTTPCRAATTANITISTALNNGDTIDGVTLATGDRVLVKNQTTGSQNGIYVVGASPARAADYAESIKIVGSVVVVTEGTTNADTAWMCTTNAPITVGSTALVFTAFGAGGGGGGTPTLEDVLTLGGNDTGGTAIISDDPSYTAPSKVLINPSVTIESHSADVGDDAGDITLHTGSSSGAALGGEIDLYGGSADGTGGNVEIYGGDAQDFDGQGGDVYLWPGSGDGTGRRGLIILHIPTSDPGVSGAMWNNGGTLKISP